MRRSGVLLIVLAMFGSACAAADPAPETAPEVEPDQMAVVEEVAVEDTSDHADDGDHDEADDHADDGHDDEADDHADDSHDDEAGAAPMADGDLDVEVELVLTDFAFDGPAMEFSPGETVRFHLENAGLIEHEFRLSNQHRIDEHIAGGHEGHGDEEGHHGETGDVVVLLEPGASTTVDITFPDDVSVYTVVACLLPDHYEAGMWMPLEYN
jgi:uncharacterized cupredoxin-like copper-binding protein